MKRTQFFKSMAGLGAASTLPFSSMAELLEQDHHVLENAAFKPRS